MGIRGFFGGGAEVETTLHRDRVRPGEQVEGVVNAKGGSSKINVKYVELALTARVEVETSDREYEKDVVYYKNRITESFQLDAGEARQIPFSLTIPWDTPFNILGGTTLHRVRIGLRTELEIARSTDKKDVDPIEVVALPAHEALLVGLSQLGFRLKGSDLERGGLKGSKLSFCQEVEFAPPDEFRSRIKELEVKFVTDEHGMDVFLEVDRRRLLASTDKMNRFHVDHDTAVRQDWATVLRDHLETIVGGGLFGGLLPSRATPNLQPAAPAYTPPPAPAPAPTYTPPAPAVQPLNLHAHTPGLTAVTVGVGWDSTVSGAAVDLDLCAVVADAGGRALSDDHFVFFNNLRSPEGAVVHGGDATTGDKHGDDEVIAVDLTKCPPHAHRIAFIVSVDGPGAFGQVRDAYIRVVNSADGQQIAHFDLDAQAATEPAVIFGELRRAGTDWTFAVVGQGNSDGLVGIVRGFGVDV